MYIRNLNRHIFGISFQVYKLTRFLHIISEAKYIYYHIKFSKSYISLLIVFSFFLTCIIIVVLLAIAKKLHGNFAPEIGEYIALRSAFELIQSLHFAIDFVWSDSPSVVHSLSKHFLLLWHLQWLQIFPFYFLLLGMSLRNWVAHYLAKHALNYVDNRVWTDNFNLILSMVSANISQ